jgi:hypothetical protein
MKHKIFLIFICFQLISGYLRLTFHSVLSPCYFRCAIKNCNCNDNGIDMFQGGSGLIYWNTTQYFGNLNYFSNIFKIPARDTFTMSEKISF